MFKQITLLLILILTVCRSAICFSNSFFLDSFSLCNKIFSFLFKETLEKLCIVGKIPVPDRLETNQVKKRTLFNKTRQ